jgi:uncharacterized membrane protein
MLKVKSTRIKSIDILRGLVMIIMALDHVRDFFYYGSFFNDPTNLETTTPILFFTRFITHYCAPVFVFLAGTSAFLYGSKKTKPELFKFLITRGIWLILLEIVVNNLIWKFDFTYSRVILQVIWAIGISMVALSFLIFLSRKVILIIGLILVAGHNVLDDIVIQGTGLRSVFWYMLHEPNVVSMTDTHSVGIFYPIIPWIGLMALGYCFRNLYQKDFNPINRKRWLLRLGTGAIVLFLILRGTNIYGDLEPWTVQKDIIHTILSFLNVTKYPPSLAHILITIGPALLFLYGIETVKNKVTNFLLVFGRVPLFYYFLHVLVIHTLAILGILIFGGNWEHMILTADSFKNATLKDYGYSLFVTYLVWMSVITILYIPCKKYMIYKANNKDKWWLSYL